MTSVLSPDQQVPEYFLQEASELLQTIDVELQTLRQGFSIQKMHSLMRAAHTLKGAASSVGLDAIKTTTHSLEDAFKALCVPDANLTPVVERLIFEAYDCLQLLFSAQSTNAQIDESGVLDRMAGVVVKLRENLGDQFGQDAYLPTSDELGFDMTKSIFEMGVNQRLDELEQAIKSSDPESLTSLLESQAEVFFGLAESLNLPGFGKIARTTVAALKHKPEQVVRIAKAALQDYRSAQTKVLQGDRIEGGAPSRTLQSLARQTPVSPKSHKTHQRHKVSRIPQKSSKPGWFSKLWSRLNQPVVQVLSPTESPSKVSQSGSVKVSSTVSEILSETPQVSEEISHGEADIGQNLDYIWDTKLSDIAVADSQQSLTAAIGSNKSIPELESSLSEANIVGSDISEPNTFESSISDTGMSEASMSEANGAENADLSLITEGELEILPPTEPSNKPPQVSETLRVSINHLEQLNHTIGELLTQQNRQVLYNQQLTTAVKAFLVHLSQQQQQLHKLQHQTLQTIPVGTSTPLNLTQRQSAEHQFDALELDHYSEQQLLIRGAFDTLVQQTESVEAIELFIRQSNQTLAKQQRLLNDLRSTMLDARMQPLEGLLQRFHQVLTRLVTQHNKSVTLTIEGGDVMVDKTIVDKLYDPLLHLLRNAFDHGIESLDIRRQQGKPEQGQIKISAKQASQYLVIKIRDDGQGLNLDAIRQKAIDNGLITVQESQQLSPTQISDLIFMPGLSTAEHVNELSGRGVGLDVVRTQVENLRGTLTVRHQLGKGTGFTLKVPAKLTIAKLLLCRAGQRLYALMTNNIEQILIPSANQIKTWNNKKILNLNVEGKEQLVLVITLSMALSYNDLLPSPQQSNVTASSDISPIILIRYRNRLVGIEVDQIIGEQELVIRSLGDLSTVPNYIYGCSILPNGRLSLVIDSGAFIFNNLQDLSQPFTNKDDGQRKKPLTRKVKSVAKQSILIIDDSITVRNTLAKALEKAGYLVVQAKEGNDALKKLQQTNVVAILCDLEMPGMNGFEFLRVRQSTPQIASVPIIMLTSRTSAKHRQLAQQLGATDYLTKPYLTPQLLMTVNNALNQQSEKNHG